ncbi:MAG: N-acetylmuramoyl-L-alanine amidase [Acidimicrobiales bacterium]
MGRLPDLIRAAGTGVLLVAAACGTSPSPSASPGAPSTPTASATVPATSSSAPATAATGSTRPAPTTATTRSTGDATSSTPATPRRRREPRRTHDRDRSGSQRANGAHPEVINRLVDIGNRRKECDTTGTATTSGYRESAHNLDVARRLQAILEAAGARVVLTRSSDDGVGPCIDERARIGNAAGADAAVSIHADGGPPGGTGFHVIRPLAMGGPVDAVVERSAALATALRASFATGTGTAPSTYLATQDGIVARDDLGGLNLSAVPKVFVETGNMQNPADAARLSDPSFRQREAEGLADGLTRFFAQG